jgi:hypothetical protein
MASGWAGLKACTTDAEARFEIGVGKAEVHDRVGKRLAVGEPVQQPRPADQAGRP